MTTPTEDDIANILKAGATLLGLFTPKRPPESQLRPAETRPPTVEHECELGYILGVNSMPMPQCMSCGAVDFAKLLIWSSGGVSSIIVTQDDVPFLEKIVEEAKLALADAAKRREMSRGPLGMPPSPAGPRTAPTTREEAIAMYEATLERLRAMPPTATAGAQPVESPGA